jgi:hypothetical protein
MNVNTGELIRLMDGKRIPEGFVELEKEEAKQADAILGEKECVFLPEDHPLRRQVAERVMSAHRPGPKAKRKQARASRKRNRR